MIRSFKDKRTQNLFDGKRHKSVPLEVARSAQRKLLQIDAAERIEILRLPPGNALERLKGDKAGQWSIRVNNQWRICFEWTDEGAESVEFIDYH